MNNIASKFSTLPVVPILIVLVFGPLWIASLLGLQEILSASIPNELEDTLLGHDLHMAIYVVIGSAIALTIAVLWALVILVQHLSRWLSHKPLLSGLPR
jgi:hypothetical protein